MIETQERQPLFVCKKDCYWFLPSREVFNSDGNLVVRFSKIEFSLLMSLTLVPGQLVNKNEIVEDVWGSRNLQGNETNRIPEAIKELRNRLKKIDPGLPNKIIGKHGGYAWRSDRL